MPDHAGPCAEVQTVQGIEATAERIAERIANLTVAIQRLAHSPAPGAFRSP